LIFLVSLLSILFMTLIMREIESGDNLDSLEERNIHLDDYENRHMITAMLILVRAPHVILY
jgi:hypothetical protein